MTHIEKIEKLTEFIKEKHGNQLRKYVNTHYYNHPIRVGILAFKHHTSNHLFLMEIGLCHDLFEDTDCTYEELFNFLRKELKYGKIEANIICEGVNHLTNEFTPEAYPGLNRKERKEKEAIRLRHIPWYCQTVKYADIIDNLPSIVKHDPPFAKVYLEEKIQLLDVMRNGSIHLLIKCCAAINDAQNELKLME
ncbi:metal-dependent phosphohydrolase [Candidatus Woesearchaeota archaeon CG_4_10_14_0_2_um_filter_33_13]|nr:MAG: metal-dependent phosphohydrolase [Candidatus Woesearchaeota archaeon CG_4_10_14_0_2_um_filter_33_13]